MGTSTKKTFYCDICPRTYDNGQALRDVALPARIYADDGESYVRGYSKLSLCPDCLNRFWEACDTSFALIEVGMRGTKIYPYFEVEKIDDPIPRWIGYQDNIPKTEKKGE